MSMKKRKSRSEPGVVLGVAWYRSKQWNRLLEIAADRDNLEDTYEEWLRCAERSLSQLSRHGIQPIKVDIDVDELFQWCLAQRCPIDAQARTKFVAEKLHQRHKVNEKWNAPRKFH